MKKKKVDKLQFNKITITNLNHSDMMNAKGGIETIDKRCAINSETTACTWAPICEGTYYCY